VGSEPEGAEPAAEQRRVQSLEQCRSVTGCKPDRSQPGASPQAFVR
jgi:hypothetical protein